MLINRNKKMLKKYKNLILKDNDLIDLGIILNIHQKEANEIILKIKEDSLFLRDYNITDYSLLLTVNEFKEEDYLNFKGVWGVYKSIDGKYLYNISIIDFLSVIK